MQKTIYSKLHSQTLAVHPAQVLALIRKDDVKANIKALWCAMYDADPILEPEYVGLTHGQVILLQQMKHAALGSGDATDRILDRLIGKPEQVNKNLTVTGTYKEFLEEVARAEGMNVGGPIDVESTSASSDQ